MIIPKNKEIKLYEAFAGIGSQFKALKNISKSKGWNIKHVGMAEWYIDAIIAFVAIHAEEINPKKEKFESNVTLSSDSKKPLGILSKGRLSNSLKSYYLNYSKNFFNNIFDIRSLNASNLPKEIDIFTYSFPCQDLSSQGLQKGIDKKLNTRSGLLWEIERILKDIKISLKTEEMPKYLLMENVKNLLASKNMKNYKKWINQLNKLGYNSKSYLLDASKFGIPQKRERVFLLSIRKDFQEKNNFKFPNFEKIEIRSNKKMKDILDQSISEFLDLDKFDFSNYTSSKSGIIKKYLQNYTAFNSENFVYHSHGIGPTLTASGAQSRIKIDLGNNLYRYLSALETYRYMGFEDKDYWRVKSTNLLSDQKIIYTAGNSIVVQVLEEIFKALVF